MNFELPDSKFFASSVISHGFIQKGTYADFELEPRFPHLGGQGSLYLPIQLSFVNIVSIMSRLYAAMHPFCLFNLSEMSTYVSISQRIKCIKEKKNGKLCKGEV